MSELRKNRQFTKLTSENRVVAVGLCQLTVSLLSFNKEGFTRFMLN